MYVVNIDQNGAFPFNYQPLYDEINALGVWSRYMQRTWIIASFLPIEEVSRRLATHISPTDFLLVTRLVRPHYGFLPQEAWTWINSMYPLYGQ